MSEKKGKNYYKDKFKNTTPFQWCVFVLLVALTVVIVVFSSYIFGENSVFDRDISGNASVNWLYRHIPALLQAVEIVTFASAVQKLTRLIFRGLIKNDPKRITVLKLLDSCCKWVIAIVAAIWILSVWGVNTAALVTSAGVLTLVVGLGLQSLVSDIVAGVFIVFEHEFDIGDIVIVNDWRGTVQEIGIRTTKIVDYKGDVNIINNSKISSVINQTRENSVVLCYVSIEYGEDLRRVEEVLKNNLAAIGERLPAVTDGPHYKGVSSLGDSGVQLLLLAGCKEQDFYQVQRDLNREIKLLFDENGINIPFPQITLNKSKNFDEKK